MHRPPSVKRSQPQPLRRRGAFLVIGLIALLLVTMLGGSMAEMALTGRRQTRRAELRLQAKWLVEAGLERAAAQLAENPDYRGETWSLPAEAWPAPFAAAVRIEVEERQQAASQTHLVTVTADYPAEAFHRARESKTVSVAMPITRPE